MPLRLVVASFLAHDAHFVFSTSLTTCPLTSGSSWLGGGESAEAVAATMLQVPRQHDSENFDGVVVVGKKPKGSLHNHYPVENTVDGKNHTEWLPNNLYDVPQWIVYDLGAVKQLDKITFLNICSPANPCDTFNISRCENSGEASCTEVAQCGEENQKPASWRFSRECDVSGSGSAIGRYWKVQFFDKTRWGGGTRVSEVWFSGPSTTLPPTPSPTPPATTTLPPTPSPTPPATTTLPPTPSPTPPASASASAPATDSNSNLVLDKLDSLMAKEEQIEETLHKFESKFVAVSEALS